ncbi:MAG: hypothetical protein HRT45_11435 [Bdellovibrionales bacterium]|nr:hypothetical protein [Bdellovibrionales bacterium]
MTKRVVILLLLAGFVLPTLASIRYESSEHFSSIMDPHPIPRKGLWFEGWYNRWVDKNTGLSLAIITTSYLSKDEAFNSTDHMSGYIAMIIQRPGAEKPIVFEAFPEDTSMRSHGEVPNKRVDFREKTDFRWQSDSFGYLTEDEIHLEIPGEIEFSAKFSGDRVPWSRTSNNIGPGGLSSFIGAIPLHWYVFSTATVSPYELSLPATDEHYTGTALVHQEKNWGQKFPKAWMWVQAINDQDTTFVLAGGQADLGLTTTEAFMGTFRDGDLVINFSPLNVRRFEKVIDADSGFFSIRVETLNHVLKIESEAPTDTFSMLSIPTEQGYLPGAVESFLATTTVKAYRKRGLIFRSLEPIAETIFHDSALEFGAGYWPGF